MSPLSPAGGNHVPKHSRESVSPGSVYNARSISIAGPRPAKGAPHGISSRSLHRISAGGEFNPSLRGAIARGADDTVNVALGGAPITPGQFVLDLGAGAITGGVTDGLLPKVQGGSNFEPFTSPRGLGPQAIRKYKSQAVGSMVDLGKDATNTGN